MPLSAALRVGTETMAFRFVFISQSPGRVAFLSQTQGSVLGGTLLSITAVGLPEAGDSDDIRIKIGASSVALESYSYDHPTGESSIEVSTPPGTAGQQSLTIAVGACGAAQASTTFQYLDLTKPYIVGSPSAIEVPVPPQATCCLKDTIGMHVRLWIARQMICCPSTAMPSHAILRTPMHSPTSATVRPCLIPRVVRMGAPR